MRSPQVTWGERIGRGTLDGSSSLKFGGQSARRVGDFVPEFVSWQERQYAGERCYDVFRERKYYQPDSAAELTIELESKQCKDRSPRGPVRALLGTIIR